jgi:serine phosphatase RsbU (regulator of sigma subunit)
VTDGLTEAQTPDGEFFGEEPLLAPEISKATLEDICAMVQAQCGSLAADDDCTLVELEYRG